MSWSPVELTAIVLWFVSIIILGGGIVATIIFYRKSRTPFAIGLGSLCACWIVGRLFALPVDFDLGEPAIGAFNLEALIALNIVFWFIVGLFFVFGSMSLFREKMQGNRFVGYWCILIITSIAVIYIALFFIQATIGNVPQITPFAGTALLYEDFYLALSWAGFVILFYALELNYRNKTRFFFTILSSFSLLFTLYENGTGQGTAALTILFMASMAGLLAIFVFMTVATLGKLRRHSLSLIFGHLCMVFMFLIDDPSGKLILAFLPDYLFVLLPPVLIIFGLILYFNGLLPLLTVAKPIVMKEKKEANKAWPAQLQPSSNVQEM